MIVGVHNLAARAVQGKLIRANRRGRLMMVGNVIGAVASVSLAYWLFPKWLPAEGPHNFFGLFAFAAGMFVVSAFVAMAVIEPEDHRLRATNRLHHAWHDAKRRTRCHVSDATIHQSGFNRRHCASLLYFFLYVYGHYSGMVLEL